MKDARANRSVSALIVINLELNDMLTVALDGLHRFIHPDLKRMW